MNKQKRVAMEEVPSNRKRTLEFGSGLWVDMTVKMLEMENLVKQEVQIKQENKMNKLMRVASLFVFVLGLGYSAVSYAEEEFSSQDHSVLASVYEKKASEQNMLVSVHERMKTDSDVRRRNQSATQMQEMERHCDGIIAAAKALKKEFLNFAEWHKKQA